MTLNLGDFQTSRMTQEAPTFLLRWNGDTLEQQWRLTTIQRGYVIDVRDEWRAVPQIESI